MQGYRWKTKYCIYIRYADESTCTTHIRFSCPVQTSYIEIVWRTLKLTSHKLIK